jgi:hypothetical protein
VTAQEELDAAIEAETEAQATFDAAGDDVSWEQEFNLDIASSTREMAQSDLDDAIYYAKTPDE